MGLGHHHHHDHGHGPHDHGDRSGDLGALRLTIVINILIVIGEVIGGLWSGSLALLSDAGHNLTDVGALAVAYFATRFATLPPTSRRSYGYYRLEILSALANGLALVGVSAFVLVEAWHRAQEPPVVDAGIVLVIATLGLLGNVASAALLVKRRDRVSIRGAFLHLVADSVSSVGVIIAGIIIVATGAYVADVVMSVLIAIVIVVSSSTLLREVVHVLLQGVPREVDPEAIKSACARCSTDILAVHDLHVWSLTSRSHVATLHVVVPEEALARSPEIIRQVSRVLHDDFGITHVTVQVEPPGFEETGVVHD